MSLLAPLFIAALADLALQPSAAPRPQPASSSTSFAPQNLHSKNRTQNPEFFLSITSTMTEATVQAKPRDTDLDELTGEEQVARDV